MIGATALTAVALALPVPAATLPPPQNSTLYYQRVTPTRVPDWGDPRRVVVAAQPPGTEAAVASAVKATGAEVYHYAQPYWLPTDRPLEGISLAEHPGWAFCGPDGTPLHGRTVTGRTGTVSTWDLYDLNERAARDAFTHYLRTVKGWGYDGVFLDLGTAALRGPYAARVSTCTADPVAPGRTFADAYLAEIRQAHAVGLRVWLNYTARPGTRDRVGPTVDQTLDETSAGLPWAAALAGHRTAQAAGNTTTLVKSRIPDRAARTADVYFRWARAKLYAEPVAVNNGDDLCGGYDPGGAATCTRYGTYPALTATRLGAPVDRGPLRRGAWVRRYAHGLVAVNPLHRRAIVRVGTGVMGCRRLYDVHAARSRPGCVRTVRVTLAAHTGRVYTYRK